MHIRLNRNLLKLAALIGTLLLLFVGGYRLLQQWEAGEAVDPSQSEDLEGPSVYLDGVGYVPKEKLTTLLLLGIDNEGEMVSSGSYLNDGQCDVVTLLVLDREEKAYTLLHLDRDTMTGVQRLGVGGTVADRTVMQLALAHTYGDGMEESCENTVDAVEHLLYDAPIDHYLAINMSGLAKLVDAVGGVTVTIRGDFSQVDPTLVEGERMTLNGKQCMTYLRGRKNVGEQTNQERSQRQSEFLQELLTQTGENYSAQDLGAVSSYMLTDLSANRLEKLVGEIQQASFDQIVRPEGEAVVNEGFMEFHPDEDALQALVIRTFYRPVEDAAG